MAALRPFPPSTGSALPATVTAAPDATGVASRLALEVLEGRPALESLAPAWRTWLRPEQATLGPDFVGCWFDTVGLARRPVTLVVRDPAGEVVGFLPLARARGGRLALAGGFDGGSHGDVVAAPGQGAAVARAIVDGLLARKGPPVRLPRLAAAGHLAAALQAHDLDDGVHLRLSAAVPRIVVPADWDTYLAGRSKHVRHEIRRRLRRWREQDGAQVRWLRSQAEVAHGIDTLMRLHARRFAGRHAHTVFRGQDLLTFHQRLAARLLHQDRLLLAVLMTGGEAVAVAYGWHLAGTTTLFQMGIRPEAEALSPGSVLVHLVLRDAVIGAGRRVLDLGEGCYDWKLRLADDVAHLVDVTVHGRGLRGFVGRTAARAGDRARRTLRRVRGAPACHGAVGAVGGSACRRGGCAG